MIYTTSPEEHCGRLILGDMIARLSLNNIFSDEIPAEVEGHNLGFMIMTEASENVECLALEHVIKFIKEKVMMNICS